LELRVAQKEIGAVCCETPAPPGSEVKRRAYFGLSISALGNSYLQTMQ
jgi:hypothetical protein